MLALHRCRSERVDIAHHQLPVTHFGGVGCVFERFHQERLRVVFDVGGKFTNLVGLSAIGIFIGYRQHLVGL